MTIFLRFLPFLIALLQASVFYLQITKPLSYPFLVLLGVLALPIASFAISWKRISLRDMLGRMLPSFVLLGTLAFALLLSEGIYAISLIIALASIASFVSLELLFLFIYHPSRYPVSGISRVNIAYVPISVWYVAATSNGLLVFLHMEKIWHVFIMLALGAVLFRTTGHEGASAPEKTLWTFLGALIGAQVGLLGVILPVSMQVQGIIAAFLLCASLRARRYLYDPKPSLKQAWIEGMSATVAFVVVLSTAKWL